MNHIYKTEYILFRLQSHALSLKKTLIDSINQYTKNIEASDLPGLSQKTIARLKANVRSDLHSDVGCYLDCKEQDIPKGFLVNPTDFFSIQRWRVYSLSDFTSTKAPRILNPKAKQNKNFVFQQTKNLYSEVVAKEISSIVIKQDVIKKEEVVENALPLQAVQALETNQDQEGGNEEFTSIPVEQPTNELLKSDEICAREFALEPGPKVSSEEPSKETVEVLTTSETFTNQEPKGYPLRPEKLDLKDTNHDLWEKNILDPQVQTQDGQASDQSTESPLEESSFLEDISEGSDIEIEFLDDMYLS